MDIINGMIVVHDGLEEQSYEIEQITVSIEEDRENVIGILRCTGIEIESKAPADLNTEAEAMLLNEFADVEYNDADGDGGYQEEIREDISERTGVDASQIDIE